MDEKKKSMFSAVAVSAIAAIFIVVAVLVLFVPQVEVKDICYFICGFVVVLGIYMIVRYFMTAGYEKLNEYGFSEGVLFVLLGICGLVSAERIAASFLTALGLLLLLSSVIKLQYALDLKCMGDKAWTVFFAVTIILLACSISIILNPFEDIKFYQNYTAYILLADGMVEIINIFYLNFRTKAYHQEMEKIRNGKKEVQKSFGAGKKEGAKESAETGNQEEPEKFAETEGLEEPRKSAETGNWKETRKSAETGNQEEPRKSAGTEGLEEPRRSAETGKWEDI